MPRFPIHNLLFHAEDVFHIVSGESDTFVLSGGETMHPLGLGFLELHGCSSLLVSVLR